MAYVDVTQRKNESVFDCLTRRRYELLRGWRFHCPCPRCMAEVKEVLKDDNKEAEVEDSKVPGLTQDSMVDPAIKKLLDQEHLDQEPKQNGSVNGNATKETAVSETD